MNTKNTTQRPEPGKPERFFLLVFFALALGVYFVSEAILRQSTVARINPEKIKIEEIFSKLPPKTLERIQERILDTNLKNNIAKAMTPQEKVSALLVYAGFRKPEQKKEKLAIYEEILKEYPDEPEAATAYIFFMFNADTSLNKVSFAKFHAFQRNLPLEKRYNAWTEAYCKLRSRPEYRDSERLEFLMPLLEITNPPFMEYYPLFEELAKYATLTDNHEVRQKAVKLADACTYRRTFAEYLRQQEEDYRYRNEMESRRSGITLK